MSTKKKVSAVMAAVLIIALLTGGAFAWTEFGQSMTNRFRGSSDNDVLLHDDFEPGVNKDVYVENTGENPLIVRVMFKEYFQIGNKSIIGGNAGDKSSWIPHLFDQNGDPADCGLETHDYFEWVLSGAQKLFKPGTGEAGNQKITENQTFPDGSKAKYTLNGKEPITMEEYKNNKAEYDAEKDGRWILDKDGWAYWSKLLPKGEATNLLLDDVIVNDRPDDNYYYAIDVILQASNRTEAKDIINSKEGLTDEAEELIEYLAGQTGNRKITGIRVKEGTGITEYREGKPFNTAGLVLIVTYDDEEEVEVSSNFTFEPKGPLSTSDTSVTITYKGHETEFPITVRPAIITDIQVKEGTAITEYTEGDPFNSDGLILIVTYDDGDVEEISAGFTVEPSGGLSTDNTFVTIKYGDEEVELPITVNRADSDGKLSFKEPYDENPSYTPPKDVDLRIRFLYSPTNGFSFEPGQNHEVGLPLADIIDGETEDISGIKITNIQISSVSRDVDISDPDEIAEYKVYISEEGKLAVSFLPTYDELVAGNPEDTDPLTDLFWKIEVPVVITLSNADGTRTGTFTINAVFIGIMDY